MQTWLTHVTRDETARKVRRPTRLLRERQRTGIRRQAGGRGINVRPGMKRTKRLTPVDEYLAGGRVGLGAGPGQYECITAHLLDHVLPPVPIRQCVLALPWPFWRRVPRLVGRGPSVMGRATHRA